MSMQNAFSKGSLLLASTFCFSSLHAFVSMGLQYDEIRAQNVIAEQNVEGVWMGRNPSYPLKDHSSSVNFFADFLYMRAEQSGLEYAQTTKNASNSTIIKGHYTDINFDWEPGVRAGLGYIFPGDDWDILLTWTYLRSNSSSSVSVSSPGTIIPLWMAALYGPTAPHAKGQWRLNYNVVDLDLGRNYFVSKGLTFRPFIGVRGAFLHQHSKFIYSGLTTLQTTPYSYTTKCKNNFDGVGLHTGFNLGWNFNKHWNLQGYLSGSLLWGRFDIDIDAHQTSTNTSPLLARNPMDIDYKTGQIVANFLLGLVVQWGTDFNCGKNRVEVSAGYEFTDWFEQNQLTKLSVPGVLNSMTVFAKGDLCLQGATGMLRFYF